METEEENILNKYKVWLIPALSLLIIFGAVAVVGQNYSVKIERKAGQPKVTVLPTPALTKPAAIWKFSPLAVEVERKGETKVDLILTLQKETRLDGMDVFLSFDPKLIEVIEIKPEKVFSSVLTRVDKLKEGRLGITAVEEGKTGGIKFGLQTKILTLTLRGLNRGEGEISLISADKGVTTVIVESGTSKKVVFNPGKIEVKVK